MSTDQPIKFEELEGETELSPPEVYAANLIEWAVERQSSDLFVSDFEKSVVVSVRRLGRVEIVRRLAKDYGRRLQGHLRVITGSDAGEMFRPSEGRGMIRTPGGEEVDVRLSSMPTMYGQDVAVRLFYPAHGALRLKDLGLDPQELSEIKRLLARHFGLILVAGPVGSGKSSTLYAALQHLNDGTRKIHTLEDPIEHAIPGVVQTGINLRAGLDFPELLSAVFRHSPDVIMIGEIRDQHTAATAVRAGASGQLVLATIHAKTAAEAIDVMLQYGVNQKFMAAALLGVINQRLMRRLEPEAGDPIETDEELPLTDRIKSRLGGANPMLVRVRDGKEDEGFAALTCVPEIMSVDQKLSEAIAAGVPAAQLHSIAFSNGMLTLAEAARVRVYRGETTAEEAMRIADDADLAPLVRLSRESDA